MIVGQLGRISKGCDHYEHFRFRLVTLTSRLMEQGFDRELLRKRVRDFYQKKKDMVGKYKKDEEEFVRGCFAKKEGKKREDEQEKKEKKKRQRERSKQRKKENTKKKME